MIAYPGQDDYSGEVGAYIAGKGYWVIPNIAEDSDDRDAASAMIAAEGALDRTTWIGWRMVNGLEGGEYPGAITWNSAHTFEATIYGLNLYLSSQPAKDEDPAPNVLHATNIVKAWGYITTDGAGNATLEDGFNISTLTVTSTYIEITFAHAFANAKYAPLVSSGDNPGQVPQVYMAGATTTTCRVYFQSHAGGGVDPSTVAVHLIIHVCGRQS